MNSQTKGRRISELIIACVFASHKMWANDERKRKWKRKKTVFENCSFRMIYRFTVELVSQWTHALTVQCSLNSLVALNFQILLKMAKRATTKAKGWFRRCRYRRRNVAAGGILIRRTEQNKLVSFHILPSCVPFFCRVIDFSRLFGSSILHWIRPTKPKCFHFHGQKCALMFSWNKKKNRAHFQLWISNLFDEQRRRCRRRLFFFTLLPLVDNTHSTTFFHSFAQCFSTVQHVLILCCAIEHLSERLTLSCRHEWRKEKLKRQWHWK